MSSVVEEEEEETSKGEEVLVAGDNHKRLKEILVKGSHKEVMVSEGTSKGEDPMIEVDPEDQGKVQSLSLADVTILVKKDTLQKDTLN